MEPEKIQEQKQRVFSGVQPTGNITIGNYLGAIKNFPLLQKKYDCIYCVVDMHSITVRQDPKELRRKTLETLALYLACGVDPKNSIVFIQSHVPQHAELCWALNCFSYVGELNRMTQFKDKSKKHSDNINAGLFDYPVLMAADILLYQTDLVPIGIDQKQHLELARNLAERFNALYSNTFKIPDGFVNKNGSKIMSLQSPTSKMSKSDENENAFIAINDNADTIVRKLKKAVTDSDAIINYDPINKPGVSNLLTIYSLFADKKMEETLAHFSGCGYGQLKSQVADIIIEKLEPIQKLQLQLLNDKSYLESVIKSGAEKAEALARKTLSKVYKKIGFVSSL